MAKCLTSESHHKGLFVTDLDGTLLKTGGGLNPVDLTALTALKEKNIIRAIATGRSLFSFKRAITYPIPIDYLIFCSGAGVIELPQFELIKSSAMKADYVNHAAAILMEEGLDFMVQKPIPEDHCFCYFQADGNPDFIHRIELYNDFAESLKPGTILGEATQLIAITPQDQGVEVYDRLKQRLNEATVIRTTSPLDHGSTWIEIFPQAVSKGKTASWLADSLGLALENIFSVGNDFNDLDILKMAGTGFVVENSPAELRALFKTVKSNNHGGVAEAIKLVLEKM